MKEEEIWKDCIGYEGLYLISNLGRIKSILCTKERIMKQSINRYGYAQIRFWDRNKKSVELVHRLVAKSFIPNPNNKSDVNHKNGIKSDNLISNLEWCTRSENVQHSFDNGLQVSLKGENHPNSKLSDIEVLKIREIGISISSRNVAKMFNTNKTTVLRIRNKKLWKHI